MPELRSGRCLIEIMVPGTACVTLQAMVSDAKAQMYALWRMRRITVHYILCSHRPQIGLLLGTCFCGVECSTPGSNSMLSSTLLYQA